MATSTRQGGVRLGGFEIPDNMVKFGSKAATVALSTVATVTLASTLFGFLSRQNEGSGTPHVLGTLADISLVLGMGCALFSTDVQKDLVEGVIFTILKRMLKGKAIPIHNERSIKKNSAKLTYYLINLLLGAAFALNLLANTKGMRNPLINLVYFFYPAVTAYVSAHDVLLHDDKSCWSDEAKRRHIVFPFSWEDNKVFAKPLNKTDVYGQEQSLNQKLFLQVGKFLAHFAVAAGCHLHGHWFFVLVSAPFAIYAHNAFNQIVDIVLDKQNLAREQNRFEHLFGDVFTIVSKGEEHPELGLHYQYFNFMNKPLQKVCKTQFFNVARKQYNMTVGEAKAASYLGRGAIVLSLLTLLKFWNWRMHLLVAMYYGAHAAVSVARSSSKFKISLKPIGLNESFDLSKVKFDFDVIRGVAMAGEMVLAAFFFYSPIAKSLLNADWTFLAA